MKNFLLVITLFWTFFSVAQPPGCEDAQCNVQENYPPVIGQPSYGTYGCLYTTPNPMWIALNINSPGNVHFVLTHYADIDFAVYGPFTSISAGCSMINNNTPQVDCSYSASSTEYIDIYGAQPGQVYLVLITNYSGSSATDYGLDGSGSTAGYDCNFNF